MKNPKLLGFLQRLISFLLLNPKFLLLYILKSQFSHSVDSLNTHLWHLFDVTFRINMFIKSNFSQSKAHTKKETKNFFSFFFNNLRKKEEGLGGQNWNPKKKIINTYPVPTPLHNYIIIPSVHPSPSISSEQSITLPRQYPSSHINILHMKFSLGKIIIRIYQKN